MLNAKADRTVANEEQSSRLWLEDLRKGLLIHVGLIIRMKNTFIKKLIRFNSTSCDRLPQRLLPDIYSMLALIRRESEQHPSI